MEKCHCNQMALYCVTVTSVTVSEEVCSAHFTLIHIRQLIFISKFMQLPMLFGDSPTDPDLQPFTDADVICVAPQAAEEMSQEDIDKATPFQK